MLASSRSPLAANDIGIAVAKFSNPGPNCFLINGDPALSQTVFNVSEVHTKTKVQPYGM